MSGARPHSAGWHVLVAGFGLKPMVGSMQRTRVWLAHCVGCRKHAIRSGSCWAAHIFGPRGVVEQGKYWPTRAGNPWATENDRKLADASQRRQLKTTTSHLAPG